MFLIPIALILAVLGFAYYAYRTAFHMTAKQKGQMPALPKSRQYAPLLENMKRLRREMLELSFEDVTVRARDGKLLYGRYHHVKDGAPVEIMVHGYRSSSLCDFSGGHQLAVEDGFNTLLIDQRAHGKSEGSAISFGLEERYDVLNWVDYAQKRFGADTPIILTGISMGAATVLMASELDLPNAVVGIIADCPYSSPKEIIQKVCRDMHMPPKLAYLFVKLGARLYGGFRLTDDGPITAVKNSKTPILLIHGEDDRFVPCDMSRRILEASNGNITLETFPGAGHGVSYLVDPMRYREITALFVGACLRQWEKRS